MTIVSGGKSGHKRMQHFLTGRASDSQTLHRNIPPKFFGKVEIVV